MIACDHGCCDCDQHRTQTQNTRRHQGLFDRTSLPPQFLDEFEEHDDVIKFGLTKLDVTYSGVEQSIDTLVSYINRQKFDFDGIAKVLYHPGNVMLVVAVSIFLLIGEGAGKTVPNLKYKYSSQPFP